MRVFLPSALTALSLSVSAFAQPFINLDFEQADIGQPADDLNFLDWEDAIPGWLPGHPLVGTLVNYRERPLSPVAAYLLVDFQSVHPTLEGNYSFGIFNGTIASSPTYLFNFITQIGFIPGEAQSIRLLAEGGFRVLIDDIEIPMLWLGGVEYGGDISTFAGSSRELKLQATARPIPQEIGQGVIVDDIQFSTEPIPEPAAGLLFIGGAVFLSTALKARRRS